MPSNGPDRLTATGSVRARYWRDALNVWSHDVAAGRRAPAPTRSRAPAYARTPIDVRTPTATCVQTLADLGLVGLLLSLAALVAWVIAAARPLGLPIPELSFGRAARRRARTTPP